MKAKKVSKLLGLTVVLVSIVLSGCGKTEETTYYDESEVEVEVAVEEEVEVEEVEEVAEETSWEAELDLDTEYAGTMYVVGDTQNLYEEPNQSSTVVSTYLVEEEVQVSGYVQTSHLFQIVDAENEILGYIDANGLIANMHDLYDSYTEEQLEEVLKAEEVQETTSTASTSESNNTTTDSSSSSNTESASSSGSSSNTTTETVEDWSAMGPQSSEDDIVWSTHVSVGVENIDASNISPHVVN